MNINQEFNAKKICNKLVEKYKLNTMRYGTIQKLRMANAHYIHDNYSIENISKKNANEIFIIDESEFTSLCGMQIWLLGIISSVLKMFRIEVVSNRNSSTIKNFIRRHIETGNVIFSDGWQAYNWLNEPSSGYQHKVHIHGAHDFGYGLESIAHIESLWA